MTGKSCDRGSTCWRFAQPTVTAILNRMSAISTEKMLTSSILLIESVSAFGRNDEGSDSLCRSLVPRISMKQVLLLVFSLPLLCTSMLVKSSAAQSSSLSDLSSQGRAALRDQQFDRAEKVYEQ